MAEVQKLEHGTAQEICDALFQNKTPDEIKTLAVNLLDHAMNHPWTDDGLKNSIVCNICREHNLVPPAEMDEDEEWNHQ